MNSHDRRVTRHTLLIVSIIIAIIVLFEICNFFLMLRIYPDHILDNSENTPGSGSRYQQIINETINATYTVTEPRWNYPSISPVTGISITPDGRYIATTTAYIWSDTLGITQKSRILFLDAKNKTILWNMTFPSSYNIDSIKYDVVMSGDGKYIGATGQKVGPIHYFSSAGSHLWEEGSIEFHEVNIAISSDGRYISIAHDDHLAYYDQKGKYIWEWYVGKPLQPKGYNFTGIHVAMSSDGKHIVAASLDSRLYYFDETGYLIWSNVTGTPLTNVAMSSYGRYIVAVSRNNSLLYFNDDGQYLWSIPLGGIPKTIAISDDGGQIVSSSDNTLVSLINRSGTIQWTHRTGAAVESVAMSRDGGTIAAGSDDRYIYCFDTNGSLLWKYETGGSVKSVAVSGDGRYIAAGSSDGSVYYFNRAGTQDT